ncbi:MAG: Uma2 family endonuclease [Chloroflexi bacterium]|nr:Uma2 family endonuclease [Chloroflexota bacterium]
MSIELVRHRFTVEEYHLIAGAGVFTEDDRVELIQGEVVEMTPIGTRHAACVDRLNEVLAERVRRQAIVRVQNPVRLGTHSEPQPDLVLLRRRADFYVAGHPTPEDILVLIEVAESSAEYDRDVKLPLYARHGVREVWLVDLARGMVEEHRVPSAAGYAQTRWIGRGEALAVEALPQLLVAVDEILGDD